MLNNLFSKLSAAIILIILSAVFPVLARATVYINEIMYDIEGSDEKKEWVEIYNDSSGEIDLKDWRFNDGSNHLLNEPPANGGRGSLLLPSFGYAILASDANTVISSYSSYSGIVIDTVMSLGNTEETLKIIDANGNIVDSVSYNSSMGANGDGKTLQKNSNSWIAGVATPGLKNGGGGLVSSSTQPTQISSTETSSNSSGDGIVSGSVSYTPKSEQISAKAGEDKTAIAGADVILEGQAFGFKGESIPNARYLWTLGDGSYKEGKNIRHIYKYPGNYIAVINASSGDVSASDRLNVRVVPNELEIIETKNEFIKLKNKSGLILDLSGWFLRAGETIFKFPDYSLISTNAELVISSDVSGLKFANDNFSAEILYPNGSPAFHYEKQKQAIPPKITESPNKLPSAVKPKEKIIAKQFENKNIETKIILNQDKVSTTSNHLIMENNLAGAIAIGGKNKSNFIWWLGLAAFVGIIGGAGIFLARKFD